MTMRIEGCILLCVLLGCGPMVTKPPGESYKGELPPMSDDERRLARDLRKHVDVLAIDIGERNLRKIDALNRAADYLTKALKDMGYDVRAHAYQVQGQAVKNLEATL